MTHSGHRERLRKKFLKGTLEDHELLELLLFYSIPRVNTNETAHKLIDQCGGLGAVFGTDGERLKRVSGVGENSVALIRLIAELMRRQALEQCHTENILSSETELHKYLSAIFIGEYEEKVYMLMFGKNGKFLSHEMIGDGLYDQSRITVKKAVKKAKEKGAEGVIIAHNHPNGIAHPSDADRLEAGKMEIIFRNAGIKILDNFIVASGKCVSFDGKNV